MHKLTASGTVVDHDLSELRLLIERQTGIVLDCTNSALSNHLADYLEAHEFDSSTALLQRLRAADDPSRLVAVLDGLINVNSGFFRHPGALNALTRQVVPQLCARKSGEGPNALRIWSAGCSTGEETYSIAIAVCEALSHGGSAGSNGNGSSNGNGNGKSSARNGGVADGGTASHHSNQGLAIHIVGSDLLQRNIEVADRGVYRQSALDGLPPATIRNYFSKTSSPALSLAAKNTVEAEEDFSDSEDKVFSAPPAPAANVAHLSVKPRLRSMVTFNCMNLARPGYIGRFDCIFCLDVLPHLSRAQRIALLERLHLYLEPGGYLFLSQTEKLVGSNLNFRSETFDGYTFHRKPLAASAAYGR
jgi:chemotaxis protein methyltransferase CheR